MNSGLFSSLKLIAEEESDRHGARLVELIVRGVPNKRVVEVFVDSEPGVNLDTCAAISRNIIEVIEAQTLIEGGYRLEVSSPGLDRPLKYPWQFRKHIGRPLSVLHVGAEQSTPKKVDLLGVEESGIRCKSGKKGEEQFIRFDEIAEATVLTPW
jgi:ribosome maturation factor RimP